MREDMDKVITERPRAGGGRGESPTYRADVHWGRLRQEGREEDSPGREATAGGLKWGDGRKRFTDVLGPLARYLRKQVGRPWDEVWSELCATLDRGSTTQRHVLEHVAHERRGFVVVHTREGEDGEVLRATGEPLVGRWLPRAGLFYVCPRTRALRHVAPRARPRGERFRKPPQVDVEARLQQVNGVWFELVFAPMPAEGTVWDTLFREHVRAAGRGDAHWKDGGRLYCASKRQLGRRELRRLGLRGGT